MLVKKVTIKNDIGESLIEIRFDGKKMKVDIHGGINRGQLI